MKKNINYELNLYILLNVLFILAIALYTAYIFYSNYTFNKAFFVSLIKKDIVKIYAEKKEGLLHKRGMMFNTRRREVNILHPGTNEYISIKKSLKKIKDFNRKDIDENIRFIKNKMIFAAYIEDDRILYADHFMPFFRIPPFIYIISLLIYNFFIYGIILYIRKHNKDENKNLDEIDSDKDKLASSLAHELKNPLAGISMFIELLERKIKEEPEIDYISNIKSQIRNLNKIISNFINYARPFKLNKSETNLETLIDEIISEYRKELSDIILTKEVIKNNVVNGDEGLLKQVFLNIILNFIDAFEDTSDKKINIKLYKTKNNMAIEFSNNGAIISDHEKERIFDPYFTTKIKGSGLGLAISRKILKSHGGDIVLKRSDENETLFLITVGGLK